LYRGEPSLYQRDDSPDGFEWIDCNDHERSLVSFVRRAADPADALLFVCNFTPVPRQNYRVGAPAPGTWIEVLNSDATLYGGSGMGNFGSVDAAPLPMHGRPWSLTITVPPLGVAVFRAPRERQPAS